MFVSSLALCALMAATPGTESISLPGGPPVGMDYLAFDARRGRVWVPAGNTGRVDVIDTATGKVTAIEGFPTAPSPRPGRPNLGPSSATIAGDLVWIGNRADHKVCAVDARSLRRQSCIPLPTMPDGLAYVGARRELWITTPRDRTITIAAVGAGAGVSGAAGLGASGKPAPQAASEAAGAASGVALATIKLPGSPEGYAVDDARGVFYTNLEDKDQTLAIDVKTRQVIATWAPGCGGEGPRGLAVDPARRLLFVACTDGAVAMDVSPSGKGKVVSRLKTGAGVDNIDYDPARRRLYVASAKDGTLTIAPVSDAGQLGAATTLPTAKGARNAVVDAAGTAYVADTQAGRIIVVRRPAP